MWNVGQRLDVIDNCRAFVESHDSREGGLDAWVPSQSFERIQERCFLATLIGARTRVGVKVKIKTRSQDVLSQPSACIGLFQGTINDVHQIAVFSPDVDIALVGADSKAGDDHPFDQLVGIVFEQWPVLAGSRLALVGVADNVLGIGRLFGYETPLHAGVEPRPTPPSEAGVLHLLDDRVRPHFERLLQGFVAVVLEIDVNRGRVRDTKPLGENLHLQRRSFGVILIIRHAFLVRQWRGVIPSEARNLALSFPARPATDPSPGPRPDEVHRDRGPPSPPGRGQEPRFRLLSKGRMGALTCTLSALPFCPLTLYPLPFSLHPLAFTLYLPHSL